MSLPVSKLIVTSYYAVIQAMGGRNYNLTTPVVTPVAANWYCTLYDNDSEHKVTLMWGLREDTGGTLETRIATTKSLLENAIKSLDWLTKKQAESAL